MLEAAQPAEGNPTRSRLIGRKPNRRSIVLSPERQLILHCFGMPKPASPIPNALRKVIAEAGEDLLGSRLIRLLRRMIGVEASIRIGMQMRGGGIQRAKTGVIRSHLICAR